MMAEAKIPPLPTSDEPTLSINTPIGPVLARGTSVFIVIALVAFGAVEFYTNDQRAREHSEIMKFLEYNGCLNRLSIYVSRVPKESTIDFSSLPLDLYNCSPRFLTERPTQRRSE